METEEEVLNGEILKSGGGVWCGNGVEQVNGEISNGDDDGDGDVYGNGVEQVNGEFGLGKVNADDVLEDLEEYWEDINDRLMISRMVSDSVIKGMVTAVEQDAAEKIANKELEVANLKESMRSGEVGAGEFRQIGELGSHWSFSEICVKHDKMREELHELRNAAREEFEKAMKEIECARGSSSIKKTSSGSELVGLGGILEEKQPESWLLVRKMLESLNSTVDTVCTKADDMLLSSKVSLCDWKQELDVSGKIKNAVTQSAVRSLQEGLDEKLWQQNAEFRTSDNVNWLEKFNEISSLRTQLDSIVKSLSIPETGLFSHGSHDFDHLNHKTISKHASLPTAFVEENGAVESSDTHVPEIYDFQQLKHMSDKELVTYFNNIITNMRRDHESALHKKTEKYFHLKRQYLKEKGSVVTHRKDEEFDVLRKKIPEVILKLEDFLLASEKLPTLTDDIATLGKLKARLEDLLLENRELRATLTDKENELRCLEAQVSDADRELLQHSLTEENNQKLVADLKSAEDSFIEVSLSEEVYKCVLRELIGQRKSYCEDLDMKFRMTREIYDIVLSKAAIHAETTSIYEIEDSDIESMIYQELSALTLTEALKDAQGKLNDSHQEVLVEKEKRISFETKVYEKEDELRLEVEEKEKYRQEILVLVTALEEKEKLATDLSISLSKEREQLELASRELSSLREHLSQQQILVTENSRACESLRAQLREAAELLEVNKIEMHTLNEKLDQGKEVLTEARKERNIALSLAQERLDKLLLCEAREEELKKEMKLAVYNIQELSRLFDDFECRISGAIKMNNSRLKDTSSQFSALSKMATVIRMGELVNKEFLERKCADLRMAEAEVDLLGDEVDALLRLLEKIYIALDHYSPILKHYPGIVDILELVRRELSGESTNKLSRSANCQG